MDLWDSTCRVIWDPDGIALVLVPYGAPMWAAVKVDGGQLVQVASYVRGTGVKALPRGNENHLLTFSIARITAGINDAWQARLYNALSLPRTMKDVLISFEDAPAAAPLRQFRLKNAAPRRWPHSQEGRVSRETVEIEGGEIILDGGTYAEGNVWGEVPKNVLLGEDGNPLISEAGEYILTES